MKKKAENIIEKLVFGSRWIQAPIYIGLIIGSILYTYKFILELIHLCQSIKEITETELMLGVLTMIDMAMVANLLIMVIIGGYATFVSRLAIDDHEDKPLWLHIMDAGTLKIKLSLALIGISGIHLLQVFINISNKKPEEIKWQIIIHLVFLASSLAIAFTEKFLHDNHKGKN